MRQFYLQGWR